MSKAAKKEETAVVTQATTAVATSAPPQAPSGILASDVIIPRMLLQQGTSDFVKERKAQSGDIVRSTDAKFLGGPETQFDFIPLAPPAPTWIKERREKGAQRWEFRGIEPRTAANDTLPWTFNADKDGRLLPEGAASTHEWKRVKCLSLFALLPQDIEEEAVEMKKADAGEMPDLTKALLPIMITFRSTGFNAGKEVVSFFTQAASFKQKAYRYMLKLSCVLESNDQGSFYVYKVDRTKPTVVKPEYQEKVQYWADIVTTQPNLKVDESGDEGASGESQPAGKSQF